MSDNKAPAAKIKLHPISAAIWANRTAKGTFYSVSFERSYKDDGGTWKTSPTFGAGDLLLLAKAADLAHTEILRQRSDQRIEQAEETAE